ncbi:hypothetical protein LPJ64_003246 [Coemansia asiatica]|uniref:RING-type domain-containing protein n=1 Tax=Coemansia asiatica TaxID=1052880 RepID=A0A9W8CIY3_9FUNG|nr:hypothetical protein LPJ64_003246 [Coemansia asiatica]
MACSICLESLIKKASRSSRQRNTEEDGNAKVSALCCGHTFHSTCIVSWLASKTVPSCPLCNKRQTGQPLTIYLPIDEDDTRSILSGHEDVDRLTAQMGGITVSANRRPGAQQSDQGSRPSQAPSAGDLSGVVQGLSDEIDRLEALVRFKEQNESILRAENSRLLQLSNKHCESIRGLQTAVKKRNEKIELLEQRANTYGGFTSSYIY